MRKTPRPAPGPGRARWPAGARPESGPPAEPGRPARSAACPRSGRRLDQVPPAPGAVHSMTGLPASCSGGGNQRGHGVISLGVWTLQDHAVAAGHSVDPERWRAFIDEVTARIAGRFVRVEPRAFITGLLSRSSAGPAGHWPSVPGMPAQTRCNDCFARPAGVSRRSPGSFGVSSICLNLPAVGNPRTIFIAPSGGLST
jgi:hypothetical protein